MSDTIVFCGGPHDGLRVNAVHADNYIRAVASSIGFENIVTDREFLYVAKRYVSPWPIANWTFFVGYDATVDAEGNEGEAYTPWWTTRVYATKDRHEEIERHLSERLSPAVSHTLWMRETGLYEEMYDYVRDDAVRYDLNRIDAALTTLYVLTHNPILEKLASG